MPLLAKTAAMRATYAGLGFTGDQMLDQPQADKWADIGMVEDIVQRVGKVFFGRLTGGGVISPLSSSLVPVW